MLAYWILFASFWIMFALWLATSRVKGYYFDAYLDATRRLDPYTAVQTLDEHPIPGFWRSFAFWKPLVDRP